MRALNSSGYKTRGGTSDGGVGGGVGAFSWWNGRLDDWPVRCSRRDHKCNHSRATCGCRIESTLGLIQLCLSISMAASLEGPSPTKGRNECSRLRTLEIFPFVSEVIVRISNTNSPT
ncbi:hypothetical protein HZH66_010132 [Vespula vulgaris]|uniref:Uncharacterized protein n=1 Tax=Vespula vulgaris TaxID=7454 RepID=A0A834MXK8_VESVU|nr:hypothetical protein HZH66_010132 [Vespula vulgaris]